MGYKQEVSDKCVEPTQNMKNCALSSRYEVLLLEGDEVLCS